MKVFEFFLFKIVKELTLAYEYNSPLDIYIIQLEWVWHD